MEAETQAVTAAPDVDALSKRLEALEAENRTLRQDQMNVLLRQQSPATPATPADPTPSEPDWSDLPDPLEDKAAYARAVHKRTAEWMQKQQASSAQQAQRQAEGAGREKALVDAFVASRPWAAGHTGEGGRLSFAAGKVLRAASAKGWDANAYMYGQQEQFFKDVEAAYRADFGDPNPPAQEETPAESPEEHLVRTGGLMGGSEGHGLPTTAGAAREPEPKSIGDILEAAQKKVGLYY